MAADAQPTSDHLCDALDEAVEANRGNASVHYYGKTLEAIQRRLRALKTRQPEPFLGVAWLIECSFKRSAPDYYCAPAVWCNNPYHAHKFKTREEAEAVSAPMTTIGDRRVVEHSWG